MITNTSINLINTENKQNNIVNKTAFRSPQKKLPAQIIPLKKMGVSYFSAVIFNREINPVQFAHQQATGEVPFFDLGELKKSLSAVANQPLERIKVGRPLLDALSEYGAIRVVNHGVPQTLVDKVLLNISSILGEPLNSLKKYIAHEIAVFRGLQAKGDPKRVFTIGHKNNVIMAGHEALNHHGEQLFNSLQSVSKDILEILSLIYEGKPDGILTRQAFQHTYDTEKPIVQDATLRQIYYPAQNELEEDGIKIQDRLQNKYVRLEPHLDYGLVTVLPASTEKGLYILPHKLGKGLESENAVRQIPLEKWVKVETKPGELLIQIGRQMDLATRNMNHPISATWHTVLADDDQLQSSRSSTALFVESKRHPLPDLAGTLKSGAHVTAAYQFPGRERFEVSSLYKLMIEKWLAESPPNKKAFTAAGQPIPEEELIRRFSNFHSTVQQAVKNNPNLIYQP
jgi:isopenicillin N synthase-like dioxygenase